MPSVFFAKTFHSNKCLGVMPALLLCGLLTAGGGCIAEDIRKELVSVNQQLTTTNETLRKLSQEQIPETQHILSDVKVLLAETKTTLVSVEGQLKDTNTRLGGLQNQLQTMNTIDASLHRLDEHLASLRGTLKRIDETIPFLSLSAEEPTTQSTTQPSTQPSTQPTRTIRVKRVTEETEPAPTTEPQK